MAKFKGKTYTQEAVGKLKGNDLLSLRNQVAEEYGGEQVKGLTTEKDVVDARKYIWSSLTGKKPKKPRTVKGAAAKRVSKPTKSLFRKLQIVKKPEKVLERWDNYKNGMTLLDVHEGENMAPTDISWYVREGYMKLVDPTDDEVKNGTAAWYKKHGISPPEKKAKK